MGIIELTVSSCLHMLRGVPPDFRKPTLGSGVIVSYKGRYFICTVEHFTNHKGQTTVIESGYFQDGQTQIYRIENYSYVEKIEFEDMPDAEDLEYIFKTGGAGKFLDMAIQEVPLFTNIRQGERVFDLESIGQITVKAGGKTIIPVDHDYEIDPSQLCSFYGRIRPDFKEDMLDFKEYLYYKLPIVEVTEHFIKLDLGGAIKDHNRFRGCSGAPIIDTRNELVALLSYGESDVKEPYVYGFRFDKIKQFIELMYFTMEQIDSINTGS